MFDTARTVIAKTRSSDVRYRRSLMATASSVSACESKRAKLDIALEESSRTKAEYSLRGASIRGHYQDECSRAWQSDGYHLHQARRIKHVALHM